jgi:hypothetical protein
MVPGVVPLGGVRREVMILESRFPEVVIVSQGVRAGGQNEGEDQGEVDFGHAASFTMHCVQLKLNLLYI